MVSDRFPREMRGRSKARLRNDFRHRSQPTEPNYKAWIQDHLEEDVTAALTAYFTALMFRLGRACSSSLASCYLVRLVAVPRVVRALKRRLPWFDEPEDLAAALNRLHEVGRALP